MSWTLRIKLQTSFFRFDLMHFCYTQSNYYNCVQLPYYSLIIYYNYPKRKWDGYHCNIFVNSTTWKPSFAHCRRIVASISNILPHSPSEKPSWKNVKWSGDLSNVDQCSQIHFIEPLNWIENVSHAEEGKINCPKCKSKLGSFSWIMGKPFSVPFNHQMAKLWFLAIWKPGKSANILM